ncbi:hypothetical protein P8452_66162 [Trifolium repens]|nr:hypothetical protein P8452_66162 [Trifolium repens]
MSGYFLAKSNFTHSLSEFHFLSNLSNRSKSLNLFIQPCFIKIQTSIMSQSPNTTSPMKSTDSPNSSPLNATPITTIHPSFDSALKPKPKKTTAKRPQLSKTPKSKKKSKT